MVAIKIILIDIERVIKSAPRFGVNELVRVLAHLSEDNKRLQKENERLNQNRPAVSAGAEEQLGLFTEAIKSLSDGLLIYDAEGKIYALNSSYKDNMAAKGVECFIGMTRFEYVEQLVKVGIRLYNVSVDGV